MNVTRNSAALTSTETDVMYCASKWLKENKYENEDAENRVIVLILKRGISTMYNARLLKFSQKERLTRLKYGQRTLFAIQIPIAKAMR